jgi:hypothetical protein
MKNTGFLAALGCLAITTAFGDEVIFKSGDRLSGTVNTVVGGKMTFTSKVAGKLTLNMADIKTFSTDATFVRGNTKIRPKPANTWRGAWPIT